MPLDTSDLTKVRGMRALLFTTLRQRTCGPTTHISRHCDRKDWHKDCCHHQGNMRRTPQSHRKVHITRSIASEKNTTTNHFSETAYDQMDGNGGGRLNRNTDTHKLICRLSSASNGLVHSLVLRNPGLHAQHKTDVCKIILAHLLSSNSVHNSTKIAATLRKDLTLSYQVFWFQCRRPRLPRGDDLCAATPLDSEK